MTVAAIDCGTNSTRLLVTDASRNPIERLMRITRLGEGVDARGALSEEAIGRTVDVLREFRDVMGRTQVTAVRVSATSAVRDAVNRDQFLDAAEAVIGTRPEVLGGLEEGRLGFSGATAGLDPSDGPFLVVDIGGGSTELVVGTTAPEGVCSLEMGCVRLTEKFLLHDPPLPEELRDALDDVHDRVEGAVVEVPGLRAGQRMVGLAGTVTTVAAIEMGLKEYDRDRIHHFWLTRAAAEDVFRTLATEDRAARLGNPGLEEARADVIVGGCVALVAVMRFFGFDGCLVSEADILDGLAATLL